MATEWNGGDLVAEVMKDYHVSENQLSPHTWSTSLMSRSSMPLLLCSWNMKELRPCFIKGIFRSVNANAQLQAESFPYVHIVTMVQLSCPPIAKIGHLQMRRLQLFLVEPSHPL